MLEEIIMDLIDRLSMALISLTIVVVFLKILVNFIQYVVIPGFREEKILRENGCCIHCGVKMSLNDRGDLCGNCWAEEKAW